MPMPETCLQRAISIRESNKIRDASVWLGTKEYWRGSIALYGVIIEAN
jgi:hypothetical protein